MNSYRTAAFKRRRRKSPGESPLAPSSGHVRRQVRQALDGRLQTKLTVGAPDDVHEQEADRMAERVMNMSDGAVNAGRAEGQIQRLCNDCQEEEAQAKFKPDHIQRQEEEEEEVQAKPKVGILQRQSEDEEEEALQAKGGTSHGDTTVSQAIAGSINSMRGKGVPLSRVERNFFEPRFGYDFSSVRIHAGPDAVHSAETIQARAFTLGSDLFFNSGEYRPGTDSGRRLIAHELTHVVQQQGGSERVQRMSFGSGAAPHSDYSEVPQEEKARVRAAMNLVEKVANNPESYPRCHNFFKDNCIGGTANSLKDKFDKATVWFDKDNTVYGSGVNPDHIAYSAETWRWGRWSLAGVFIHEMMHRCGQHNEETDDRAIVSCGFPDIAAYKAGKSDATK